MPASIATPGFLIAISAPSMAIGPGGRGRDAEQRLGDVAAARADEAGEAENLALAQIEGNVAEPPFERQVAHRQRDIADRHDLLGEHLRDLAPDHQPDDVVAGDVRGRVLADETAVAEHRHLIGDLEQFVHLVGDVDDALALGLEGADDLEEMLDLAFGQRRGRLVHDENVGIVGHSLGDLDHLPVGDGEIAHLRLADRSRCRAARTAPWFAGASRCDARSRGCSAVRGGSRCSRPPS